MIVETGSRWWDGRGTYFHVLDVLDIEGKTWVHYIKEGNMSHERLSGENEYSCYVESFVSRFTRVTD
jgi:hypothetical protein